MHSLILPLLKEDNNKNNCYDKILRNEKTHNINDTQYSNWLNF